MIFRDPSRDRTLTAVVVLAAAVFAAACGGTNPAGPSGGVVVDGTVLGASGAGEIHASAGPSTAGDPVTVVCQEDTALTTTVSGDGRFTLRDLPAGGFTLQFKQGGRRLGTVSFQDVKANQQIVVTVLLTGSGVEVVDEKRDGDEAAGDASFTCAANQKAEVEGVIGSKGTADITVNQTGKGAYLVDVPAGTSIKKGNKTYTFADLAAGWRVHVSGTSLGFTTAGGGNACHVRASEVKVQQD